MRWPRPLDPMRSIKVKLGALVVGTLTATVSVVIIGLHDGIEARYLFPIGGVVSLALVQVLGHGITAPLREMAAASRAMARGDYSRQVRATSRDEVGQLAQAFNTMAGDLARVDRQRRELIANVSHELRTPISALQAVLENVVDGVAEPDPDTMRDALAQTQRLGRLITQLLDLSRLESGAVPLECRTFGVAPFLADAARRQQLGGRDVAISLRVEPPELSVHGDPDRLHQVLANLLDNATRHTPVGGSVRLEACPSGRGVRLSVTDDGPGIPAQHREHVFERFSRLDDARSADAGGSGLGLSIARWVVDLHGGTIAVVDSPRGCRIDVDLPPAGPRPARASKSGTVAPVGSAARSRP
jgi:signal transduction histidine kinase